MAFWRLRVSTVLAEVDSALPKGVITYRSVFVTQKQQNVNVFITDVTQRFEQHNGCFLITETIFRSFKILLLRG